MQHPRANEYPDESANSSRGTRGGYGSARSPGMRILTRVSSTSIRRSPGAGQNSGGCPMDCSGATGHTGHFMHPSPPRSLDYYGFRVPYMPPQSTPMHSYNLPSQHETFGSQIDYNLSWMPKDVQLSDAVDPSILMAARARKGLSAKYTRDANAAMMNTSTIDTKYLETTDVDDSRFLLNQSRLNEAMSTSKRSPKRESLIEWFDRTVESELKKRREGSLNIGENLVNLESPSRLPLSVSVKQLSSNKYLLAEASASGIDIQAGVKGRQDTEFLDAIDKLAKAEAMCAFEGAVNAAEQAARAAPPELAEEAAAASAQGFQTEITNIVRQDITDGVKPIEVVGYVGITRPKKPKKSNVDGSCS